MQKKNEKGEKAYRTCSDSFKQIFACAVNVMCSQSHVQRNSTKATEATKETGQTTEATGEDDRRGRPKHQAGREPEAKEETKATEARETD
ncbi:hypothetical protein RRG08_012676 [Elysia crispata]|uniref:Uncharacterized protein n=1 Tax=Elysia crispata TaxID=231223 RepID=A0AAE0YNS2_9GAST|nr:hypothetical protein RRG08_012676 [Elysia crispata]